ncbi:glycosyltransferase family 1 protein [bacterium]|nr:glycosyltransferase family 1 protein [bacterium]
MKTIAFYQPHLDIQGTGVSYFDYAYYNEKILGNKSIMIYDQHHPSTHPLAEKKFKDALEVVALEGSENMEALKKICLSKKVDALYIQKCGRPDDGRFISEIPTFIHVVGVCNEPHGTVYAYVSKWLSQHCSNNQHPYVSYIVQLPDVAENFRNKLGIPSDAIVFGRTGGPYSWNIPFVNKVIEEILELRENCYFLFANTTPFITHKRVLFIEPFADLNIKRKFINTCDAMLHARNEGESFGAAVGEFSLCNKPVITYNNSPERSHITILGDKGLYYHDEQSLKNILLNLNNYLGKDFNAYRNYTPEKIMHYFKTIFIDKI